MGKGPMGARKRQEPQPERQMRISKKTRGEERQYDEANKKKETQRDRDPEGRKPSARRRTKKKSQKKGTELLMK